MSECVHGLGLCTGSCERPRDAATVARGIIKRMNDEALKRESRVRALEAALGEIVRQVEIGNAVDDHGHELKNLKALHDARALLAPPATTREEN